jgi:hypothetical protein
MLIHSIQPITKHIDNIVWRTNIISEEHHAPNNVGKGQTINKCSTVSTESQKQHLVHPF